MLNPTYILIPLFLFWSWLPSKCDSLPTESLSLNSNQWKNIMKDAMRYLEKQHEQQQRVVEHSKPKIRLMVDPAYSGSGTGAIPANGMVKLRNIRSGYGDLTNAVRLYQLHELEKEWASKARPRFGKRAEVTQDNFLPPYPVLARGEDYDNQDRDVDYMARGNSKQVRAGSLHVPEDYAQDSLKDEAAVKYSAEDYSIPNASK